MYRNKLYFFFWSFWLKEKKKKQLDLVEIENLLLQEYNGFLVDLRKKLELGAEKLFGVLPYLFIYWFNRYLLRTSSVPNIQPSEYIAIGKTHNVSFPSPNIPVSVFSLYLWKPVLCASQCICRKYILPIAHTFYLSSILETTPSWEYSLLLPTTDLRWRD